ncbi:MAG: hypothetical protein MGF17_12485 [Trichodesmium sp. MAG_R04]|nr:hypothetical protein [Trichodesmium sp. MAG_R04]
MLSLVLDLKNSNLFYTGDLLPYAKLWYSQVRNSQGFMPYKEKEVEFPEELLPLLEEC